MKDFTAITGVRSDQVKNSAAGPEVAWGQKNIKAWNIWGLFGWHMFLNKESGKDVKCGPELLLKILTWL